MKIYTRRYIPQELYHLFVRCLARDYESDEPWTMAVKVQVIDRHRGDAIAAHAKSRSRVITSSGRRS